MFFFPRRQVRKPAPSGISSRIELLETRENPVVVANADTYSVAAGQVLTIPANQGVLVNDFDDSDSGAVLSANLLVGAKYTAANAPPLPNGSLTLNQNGSFTFIAPSNFDPNFGNITFQYTAVNRDAVPPGNTAIATVTINITGVSGKQKLYAVATGPGAPAEVKVYQAGTGNLLYDFFPYEQTFTGGVHVATGDLNKDGVDDIVVAPASGGSARIKVYDGKFGTQLSDFFVFEPSFRGGADVAIGDVNGDTFNDLIVGAGDGGGPRVQVYSGKDAATGLPSLGNLTTPTNTTLSQNQIMDFFAYESTFRNGVRVAAGDLYGTRVADPTRGRDFIVTGTFAGGGPAVRVFDGIQVANAIQIGVNAPPIIASFFAFDSNDRGGVNVAVGMFRNDGKADIVAGTGDGNSVVRVFDGRTDSQLKEFSITTTAQPSGSIAPTGGENGGSGGLFQAGNAAGSTPSSLFTGTSNNSNVGGAVVAVADRNGDGVSDIVAAVGSGANSTVHIYDGTNLSEISNFLAFPSTFLGGVFVGGNSL